MASPIRSHLSAHSTGAMMSSSAYVLSSWKEIAAYLKKSVRTVQRWESCLGLPVHRPGEQGVVLAYEAELDQWVRQGGALPDGNGHGNGHAGAGERFRRYDDARRRAAVLCSAAGDRIQALRSTALRTRAICAALKDSAALWQVRSVHPCDLLAKVAAPPPGHGYRNVTVDDGGSDVEGGASESRVA